MVEQMATARVTQGYAEFDGQRWVPEPIKSADRTDFARDRARVLHSSALRRLAAKTQVHMAGEDDFPRTRLTHTLEVAQIGRELAFALGSDPDIVETACLAHDIGHPPFGHNGERVLNEISEDIGGFEGNAQTLRILTRLEPKVVGIPTGGHVERGVGLNLTRAGLDAAVKYPWRREAGRRKFGVYDDDTDVFAWIREQLPEGTEQSCIETDIMDWSDDVAYSVHDVEDAVHSGLVKLSRLDDPAKLEAVLVLASDSYLPDAEPAELSQALTRLQALSVWPHYFDGSERSQAQLKAFTSELIGRFCWAVVRETRKEYPQQRVTRYDGRLIIPREQRAEVAVLKAIADHFVMRRREAKLLYERQRELLTELVAHLRHQEESGLDPFFAQQWRNASTDAQRERVIIDQVASLTDTSIVRWWQRSKPEGQEWV